MGLKCLDLKVLAILCFLPVQTDQNLPATCVGQLHALALLLLPVAKFTSQKRLAMAGRAAGQPVSGKSLRVQLAPLLLQPVNGFKTKPRIRAFRRVLTRSFSEFPPH